MGNPRQRGRRSGATIVEAAIVLSALFVLLIGLLVGGLGVFRYQEMAHAAREVARYAAVHGSQFKKNNSGAATVDLAALKAYAATKVSSIDTSKWTITVKMTCFAPGATSASLTPPATTTVNWDDTTANSDHSPYSTWTNTTTSTSTTAANLVTVTITYPWYPEAFIGGPINLTSTAVMAMSY